MKKYLILIVLLVVSNILMAQTADTSKKEKKNSSMDALLDSVSTDNKIHNVAIFKASRLVLSQSTEMTKKKNLNFLVIHRFGDVGGKNGGGKFYYGLDDVADVYIGFEYGISDNFNIDIGRTTIGGLADLELKYALLHQKSDNSSPIAITLIGEGGVRPYGFVTYPTFGDRLSYFAQAIFARKFSSAFSLQVAPSYLRDNLPMPAIVGNEQQFVSLSATGVLKVSKHMGIIVDYAHPFSSFRQHNSNFTDPIGFGIQTETGGHVFTINFTNSRAVDEINYLNDTESKYSKGQFRIGFTISRMFDFNHNK
ncbi:DUF5777 family beta-barrel protein [Mucilaginibacter sp.]